MSDWNKKYYAPLEGAKIEGVEIENDGEYDWPVLKVLTKDGDLIECTIMRDPEGNGPGWIDGLPYPK
jgi:hypothetical protein